MDARGGVPAVRDAVLLDLVNTTPTIDGFALSGGSAHGL
jgi:L-aminopeptidase/D-esterase-like protein